MNNVISHKFHYISRQEQQELLAVARGEAVADYIIDNVILLDIINGGEMTGPIVIKGRHIAGIGAEYCDVTAHRRPRRNGSTRLYRLSPAH